MLAGIGLILYVLLLAPQNRPFAELDLEHPIGVFTRMRLANLNGMPTVCRQTIAASPLEVEPVEGVEEGFCHLRDAVSLTRSLHPYSQTTRITCPLAAALYVWEREIVAPAAQKHFGADVNRIEVMGTYQCRRVYGRRTGAVSNHALGAAIDIGGFRLADGRIVSVLRHWSGDTPQARFLHEVRDGACKVFQTVLSPDYNAAHRNHFHLDMGRGALCR